MWFGNLRGHVLLRFSFVDCAPLRRRCAPALRRGDFLDVNYVAVVGPAFSHCGLARCGLRPFLGPCSPAVTSVSSLGLEPCAIMVSWEAGPFALEK